MLNPPIENDWKNDAIKKIDKCIFKTISASEKENAKLKAKKEKLIKKILKAKVKEKEKNKENEKSELKQKKPKQFKLKFKGSCGLNNFKDKEPLSFELLSANKDCILLKRKKLREVNLTFFYAFLLNIFIFYLVICLICFAFRLYLMF
jgi:hypothetical protein